MNKTPVPTPRPTGGRTIDPTRASPTRRTIEPTGPIPTVLDLINRIGPFSTFAAAIASASAQEIFGTWEPLTVFAPDDVAFNRLGLDYVELLITNSSYILHLYGVVFNHATNGTTYLESNLTNGSTFTTLSGEEIKVEVLGNAVGLVTYAVEQGFTDAVEVSQFNTFASNGVIHTVDHVLIPLWYYYDILTLLESRPDRFSTLRNLLSIAGLDELVSSVSFATLVAPSNEAFAKLSNDTLDYLTSEEGLPDLRQILSYHLIPTLIAFPSLNLGVIKVATYAGEDIKVKLGQNRQEELALSFDRVPVNTFLLTKDTVAYQIDTVLLPSGVELGPTASPVAAPSATSSPTVALPTSLTSQPTATPVETLFTYISDQRQLSYFAQALSHIGGDTALADPDRGPFTVFAPNNRVLKQTIGNDYLASLLEPGYDLHLRSFTLYHTAGQQLLAANLTNQLLITMSNRLGLRVARDGDSIQLITSAVDDGDGEPVNVIGPNAALTVNGVLHDVDAPILPFWYFATPATALASLAQLSFLASLVEGASLTPTFRELEDSTLLLPNNNAFSALSAERLAFLQDPENVDVLEQVLRYHVIPELAPFTNLDVGDQVFQTQLSGENVTITVSETNGDGRVLRINGVAGVRSAYFLSKTDLMYEIDTLLIPESLVSIIPLGDLIDPPLTVDDPGELNPVGGLSMGDMVMDFVPASVVKEGQSK